MVHLIGCYFTIGGGAFRVNISEDETSQKDVCFAHVNLKLHCSLQEEQGEEGRCREGAGGGGDLQGRSTGRRRGGAGGCGGNVTVNSLN